MGVSAIQDAKALLLLGDLGQAMLAQEETPAVMSVKPYLEKPTINGAKAVLPTEMRYRVELWRSDLLSGVIEVDSHGVIVPNTFVKEQPAYSPHLLLGMPESILHGAPLAAVLGVNQSYASLVDNMFSEGGLSARNLLHSLRRIGKGGLRATKQKREVGPVHTVKLKHATD